jgi:hypothetical protein
MHTPRHGRPELTPHTQYATFLLLRFVARLGGFLADSEHSNPTRDADDLRANGRLLHDRTAIISHQKAEKPLCCGSGFS